MKQINYILILLLLCCITACNDWLEVAPQAEKEESEMFEKEAGFRNVLIGAYIRMKSNNLYGEDLTYGSIEMLAQHWTNTDDLGKYLKAYNYEQGDVETKINSFYGNLYKVIADVNGLLNNINRAITTRLSKERPWLSGLFATSMYCAYSVPYRLICPKEPFFLTSLQFLSSPITWSPITILLPSYWLI